ncbi:hypothetical protein I8752_28645 [Nostocaceae cyanobacterium CENA369]|uniref:Uncharacterized protein n=1 Tax=Dendronalium phyllosphericum CENA369 TaxID=1725256 RepID=A0A8J7I6F3_9NOST|nr:hypothetical protein [Dendronalium phyllosphericum]MBH8576886.1 hypothetical protein [Dendronalium phyllosphericum CENA369]
MQLYYKRTLQCNRQAIAPKFSSFGLVVNSDNRSVTTGTNWKFMRLTGQIVEIDLNEYFLSDVGQILGILRSFVEAKP